MIGDLACHFSTQTKTTIRAAPTQKESNNSWRVPWILVTTPLERKQNAHSACDQEEATDIVDDLKLVTDRTLGRREVKEENNHHKSNGANWNVDVETPSPTSVVSQCATEKRTYNGGDTKTSTKHSLIFSTITNRNQIGNDDHNHTHDPATVE
jgi:hypothetical protein